MLIILAITIIATTFTMFKPTITQTTILLAWEIQLTKIISVLTTLFLLILTVRFQSRVTLKE